MCQLLEVDTEWSYGEIIFCYLEAFTRLLERLLTYVKSLANPSHRYLLYTLNLLIVLVQKWILMFSFYQKLMRMVCIIPELIHLSPYLYLYLYLSPSPLLFLSLSLSLCPSRYLSLSLSFFTLFHCSLFLSLFSSLSLSLPISISIIFSLNRFFSLFLGPMVQRHVSLFLHWGEMDEHSL